MEVTFVLEVSEVKFGHLSGVFCERAMPGGERGQVQRAGRGQNTKMLPVCLWRTKNIISII